MIIERVFIALLLLGMVVPSNCALGIQLKQSEMIPAKLKVFLHTAEELRDYSRTGYTSNFTGQLRAVPEKLQIELKKEFPLYQFHIAKMRVMIDLPPDIYDLILVTRTDSGDVQSFLWGQYWMIPASKTWGQLLAGQQAMSKEDAINKVRTLAKLIAYTATADVGQATAAQGKLKVELLRDSKPFGFLELKIDKHLRLGRLTITGPSGKKLPHFAWR